MAMLLLLFDSPAHGASVAGKANQRLHRMAATQSHRPTTPSSDTPQPALNVNPNAHIHLRRAGAAHHRGPAAWQTGLLSPTAQSKASTAIPRSPKCAPKCSPKCVTP